MTPSPAARAISCFLSLLLAFGLSDRAFGDEPRPNIVLIIGDDQAWMDYGFMGHPVVRTPELDQLAARSLVFQRGYVASPLCRPSLASILTGRSPSRHGITGNDVRGYEKRAALDVPFRERFQELPTVVKLLTSNGYLAHQSGKWWEGSYRDGGFTHGMTHGNPERGGRHGDEGLKIGRKTMKPIKNFIDLATAEDRPFFVWYAPFLPHTPHNPPPRLLKKYVAAERPADVSRYYAMCEWFDETCGELLHYLDEKRLRENTAVLFISDNGWAARSTNADDPRQSRWQSYALRSKGSPYEQGIRTPILVSWPGRVRPERAPQLAHAIDLFPTVAAMAGFEEPANLRGINLLDANARDDRKAIYGVCHSVQNMTLGEPDKNLQYLWCVENQWKLILRYHGTDTTRYRNLHAWDQAAHHLYNLKQDPHEQDDLAASRPDVVARLKDAIRQWHTDD